MSATNTTTRNKHSDGVNSVNNKNNCETGGNFNRSSSPSFDITKDELSRISEALKKEEFRKLFLDYCEEIQDPENRKRYEDEIKQLEAERGVDVRFINPEPGFVIKTSADGLLKCFINVAKSPEVAKPTNEVSFNEESGKRGISWSLPMAQAPPRDDLDAHNKRCRVYDVVFHPDALYLAKRNNEFRKCLIDTALDAVEREFKVNLDRTNLKFPKLDYKGVARPTVIRKLAKNPPSETTEPHPLDNIYPARPTADAGQPKILPIKITIPPKPEFTLPKYVIKHRRGIDLTEYTEELDAKLNIMLPRELVVEIELPLLPTASECQLDVTERSIYLLSERAGAKYRLKIELPYTVNDKEGAARFDTDTRRLSITLPVIQPSMESQRNMHEKILHLNREDSGVDSDMRDESTTDSSPSESPVQDLVNVFQNNDNNKTEELHEELNVEDAEAESQAEDEKNSEECTLPPNFLPEITSETFLLANVPYKLPEKFDCNVLDDVMSFVLHVRNVQPVSIIKLQLPRSVHLHFTSIGSGYYPNYYAFYLQLPAECELEIISTDVEAWENNVVLNVQLSGQGEFLKTYLAGINSKEVNSYNIRNQFKAIENSRLQKRLGLIANGPISSALEIAIARPKAEAGDAVEIEIKPRDSDSSSSTTGYNNTGYGATTTTTEDEEAKAGGDAQAAQKNLSRKQKKNQKKQRSLSESACDDIKIAIKQMEADKMEANRMEAEKNESTTSETSETSSTPSITKLEVSKAIPTKLSSKTLRKQRSYSECRDNFVALNEVSSLSLPCKGILKHYSRYDHGKHHQARYFTSDSCSSSVEDCSSFSSSIENASSGVLTTMHFSKSFSDIPEENASATSGLSESCKKTVRFNDIIQKQTFKLDSSILGQRKKNQKRRDRKQRAIQRRLSEGDSADYEEDHKPIIFKKETKSTPKTKPDTSDDNGKGDGAKLKTSSDSISKKSVKGRKKRQSAASTNSYARQESESSDVDGSKGTMMFEIDLE